MQKLYEKTNSQNLDENCCSKMKTYSEKREYVVTLI